MLYLVSHPLERSDCKGVTLRVLIAFYISVQTIGLDEEIVAIRYRTATILSRSSFRVTLIMRSDSVRINSGSAQTFANIFNLDGR